MKRSLKKLLTVSLAASVLFGADISMVIAENISEVSSEQVQNSESEYRYTNGWFTISQES